MTEIESYYLLKFGEQEACYYDIQGNILYMKILFIPEGMTEEACENFYAQEISKLEGVQFYLISYLNV